MPNSGYPRASPERPRRRDEGNGRNFGRDLVLSARNRSVDGALHCTPVFRASQRILRCRRARISSAATAPSVNATQKQAANRAFGCFGICLLDARQTARAIQLIEDGSDGNFLNSRAQIAITLASEEIGNGRLEHDIAALFARLP